LSLIFKISLTLIFWSLLPLLLPPSWLEFLGLPQQSSYVFIKLYGMAALALVVGYGFGLRESCPSKNKQARRAMGFIRVGIVSNTGACLVLLLYGLSGTWNAWGFFFAVWAVVLNACNWTDCSKFNYIWSA
jgi:hypothetical protein